MELAATALTSTIGQTILGGLGSALVGKALSPKQMAPQLPKPAVMPTPDDTTILAAKRRQAAEIQQRSGRQSTILSTDEKLGG